MQNAIGARKLLIGADFNTSRFVLKPALEGTGLNIHRQINKPQRRKHKTIIDFFIASKDIKCKSVIAQKDVPGIDYLQVESCFDHDPILAEFSVPWEDRSDTQSKSLKAHVENLRRLHNTHTTEILQMLK